MISTQHGRALIGAVQPGKIYSASILKVARHFWTVSMDALVRDLAEEFRHRPEVPAAAVVDQDGRSYGIVRAERLFYLLGKPFGLEILGRTTVREVMEECPRWLAQEELFKVTAQILPGSGEGAVGWHLLEDGEGRFAGFFTAQDLSNYLSGITRRDVESAGRLQERLIAGQELLSGAGWRVEAWSRPAAGIGGDLTFVRKLSEDQAFLCLCDVSGKGVSASVLVSMIWGMLRMHDYDRGQTRLLRELNSAVVEAFHLEKYLTGVFLSWDGRTRKLSCADMGHSHIFVFRGCMPARVRSARRNLPLGLDPALEPSFNSWCLEPGDVILVYSDGFTEQENLQGKEYGERRLCGAVRRCLEAGKPLAEGLPDDLDGFRGSLPQQDDASFIALHIG
ncbi:MAG TPA: SpoIIE family protein phosphatase [Magnetospirillaceae bacterium]|nr:SpoIIE family protein phosphatase [Magnetospirillaceae bacterium]